MSINLYFRKAKKLLFTEKNVYRALSLAGLSFLIFISIKIFYFFEYKKDRVAFLDVFELIERYDGALKSSKNFPLEELNKELDQNYLKNKRSIFAPYLQAIKSMSLSFQDNSDEAIKSMSNSLNKLKKNSEVYFLHKLTLSLMLLNSEIKENKENGIKMINSLIDDSKNPLHEIAIFYYGLFLMNKVSLKEANKVWKPILSDPKYRNSIYKELIKKAKNWDY